MIRTKFFTTVFLLSFTFSSIGFAQQNSEQYNNYLFYSCKVWGYLKYFHSNIAKGNVLWDEFLIKNVGKLKNVSSKNEFDNFLTDMINAAGKMDDPTTTLPIVPNELRYNLNLSWFQNNSFSSSVSEKLKEVESKFRPRTNYYIKAIQGVGNPDLSADNLFYNEVNTTQEQRLLCLFRYWNIINYFFPYKNLLDKDWDLVLKEFIPKFVNSNNETDYTYAFLELAANINDAHGVSSNTTLIYSILGQNRLPILLKYVEGKTIISKVATGITSVKPGDIIRKIGRETIEERKKKISPIITSSNKASFERNLNSYLISFDMSQSVEVEIENESGQQKVTLATISSSNYYNSFYQKTNPSWRFINRNNKRFGIVDMGVLTTGQIPQMFNELWNTDAIIFDIRNYPNSTMWYMINYLFPSQIMVARFTSPDITYPGTLSWTSATVGTGDFSKNYNKNIYILFNEDTQSQAEYTIMALEQHPKAVKIGSQTAGADGNVSYIYLPGGIRTMFTGLGVFYPDYRPTQRIGIVPHIYCEPTIAGIRAGEDEVLNKTINHYLKITDSLPKVIPTNFSLSQNFPNPFNPGTNIAYQIPENTHVILKIIDALGREVAELENMFKPAGAYTFNFDANKHGLSSGVYFYRLTTYKHTKTLKMVFVK